MNVPMRKAVRPSLLLSLSALLLALTATAHAAPIGTFSCSGPGLPKPVNMQISYLDMGVTSPTSTTGSQGTVGAGRPSYRPIVIHVSISQASNAFEIQTTNRRLETCHLKTSMNGAAVDLLLRDAQFTSTDLTVAPATLNQPAKGFVAVGVVYSSVSVTNVGSASDDGGTP